MNYTAMVDKIDTDLEIKKRIRHICPVVQALWNGDRRRATNDQRYLQAFCSECPSSGDIPHDKDESCPDLCNCHVDACVLFRRDATKPWGNCELADVCPCFCDVSPEWREAFNRWKANRRLVKKTIDTDDDDAV